MQGKQCHTEHFAAHLQSECLPELLLQLMCLVSAIAVKEGIPLWSTHKVGYGNTVCPEKDTQQSRWWSSCSKVLVAKGQE